MNQREQTQTTRKPAESIVLGEGTEWRRCVCGVCVCACVRRCNTITHDGFIIIFFLRCKCSLFRPATVAAACAFVK